MIIVSGLTMLARANAAPSAADGAGQSPWLVPY